MANYREERRGEAGRRGAQHQGEPDFGSREMDRQYGPLGSDWDQPLDERYYDRGSQYDVGGYRRGRGTEFDYEPIYERDRDERRGPRRESRDEEPDFGHERRFERGRYAGTNTYDPGYGGSGPGGDYQRGGDTAYDRSDYSHSAGRGRSRGSDEGSHLDDYRGERTWGGTASGNLMRGPHHGRGPKGYQRPDERIHEDVCERLTHHGHLDASGIEVQVENAEVTLKGSVPNREMKRLADELANTVTGVLDVHNRLHLEGRERKTEERSQSSSGRESRSRAAQPSGGQRMASARGTTAEAGGTEQERSANGSADGAQ